jgi:hypothetical protein
VERDPSGENLEREGQQQVLGATFSGIWKSAAELVGKQADALARKFHETHDMKVEDELERLLREYGRLGKAMGVCSEIRAERKPGL